MPLVRVVDTNLYPLKAVQQAASEFRERCAVETTSTNEGRVVVSVEAADPTNILEFWNRALECSLIDRL